MIDVRVLVSGIIGLLTRGRADAEPRVEIRDHRGLVTRTSGCADPALPREPD